MTKYLYNLLISFLLISAMPSYAQDPQFSQVYAIPLYMGPSFAGSSGGTRVGLNFRDQWPGVDKDYISYALSVDHFFSGTNTGAGVMLFRDQSGLGKLMTTSLTLQYAYSFNLTKKLSLRPGIQFAIAERRIDYSNLVFGDQISLEGTKPETIEPGLEQSKIYIDFGSSLLLNHERYWLGVNLDHLSRPNQSLTGQKSPIPIKSNVFGGVKFMIKRHNFKSYNRNIYVMFQYKMQDEYKQAFVGTYWQNNNYIMGLWYRGIPLLRTYDKYLNNDALVFLIGYRYLDFSLGYSYDFTTSRLAGNSAGSHEVSLIWTHINKSRKPKKTVVSCPTL